MASLIEDLFTALSGEKEIYEKLIPVSEKKTEILTRGDLKELEESLKNSSLPEKAKEILGINAGGANANNFVWCGATYTDELGTSGQALNFMTQVMDKSANADKLRGKNPADDRYMGTALCKILDNESGKLVTVRVIVITAEPVDKK